VQNLRKERLMERLFSEAEGRVGGDERGTFFKSLRKNGQKRRVPPSRDLITRCSGWISLIQRFRTPDFRRFAPLGLPGSRLIGTPLGNHLLMPPPSPV
jgi:hypothetical protein